MAYLFPSAEWVAAFREALNASEPYKVSAAKWEGDFYFIVEPKGIIKEPVKFYLDLWHGECREAHLVTEAAPGPEDMLIRREQIGYLHHAIGSLPERLQFVVTEYFLKERPMADIADELGVTESRVSQLHTQAITRLRTILSGYVQDGMPAM